jgi:hypothetical protein
LRFAALAGVGRASTKVQAIPKGTAVHTRRPAM